MNDNKMMQYIDEINKSSRRGKLVFFVGAGVSSLSGYPKWSKLVDVFYKELYGEEKGEENEFTSDEYLKIPQMYYDVLEKSEKNKYDDILKNVFDVDSEPNEIHYKLLSLNPAHIITTNYDDLLEKTCCQRGKYYTKISREKDVSAKLLLKVHGDFSDGFKGDNIVLKESDYMSYEQNHPLISNLMKSIMSTYTIVFIGYGLGDYNINLLLNWVKQLQKSDFKRPFFIRTDEEAIKKIDEKYFYNKGLRIIDSASLIESQKNEYLKRYNAVMDRLIDYRNNKIIKDDEIIELIYSKIQPLFALKSIRKTDLNYVFDNDYIFNVDGKIYSNNWTKDNGYLERFYNIKIESVETSIENINEKYNTILDFFKKYNILGMFNKVESKGISINIKVTNLIFDSNFEEIEQLINSENDAAEVLYKKAFYLANMGNMEEAYDLYTQIINDSMKNKNFLIYYLSQINRYYLYKIIKNIKTNLDTFDRLNYREHYQPFSQEFIDKIYNELNNFNLNNLFSSMPSEFQEDYKILEILSDNRFLYDDIVKLFELTNRVEDSISKRATSARLKSEVKVMLSMYETTKFLFDNHMLSIYITEFKSYVKNSIILQFKKAAFDYDRNIKESKFIELASLFNFHMNYFVFVSISKNFNIEDIKYVEKICDISKIPFKEENKIEEYILRLVSIFKKHYKNGQSNKDIVFYKLFIDEIKTAIYLARYVSLSQQCIRKLIEAILYFISINKFDNGKKYILINRLIEVNGLSEDSLKVIDDFLLKESQRLKTSNYHELSAYKIFLNKFTFLISNYYPKYVSDKLSQYVLSLKNSSEKEINHFYKLSKILSAKAKKYLKDKKNIKNIYDIYDGLDVGNIDNIGEYDELIIKYVSDRMIQIKEKNLMSDNEYLIDIARQFFMGNFKNDKLKDYTGIVDEYDMFVDPNSFDYSKFKLYWLKKYPDELFMKIYENKYMHDSISKCIKQNADNLKDARYISILCKYFL